MWYRKAADQGNAKAQCALGIMYSQCRGVPKKTAKGLLSHRAAAQVKQEALKCAAELESMQLSPAWIRLGGCANCGVLEATGGAALKPCVRCKSAHIAEASAKSSTGMRREDRKAPARPYPVDVPRALAFRVMEARLMSVTSQQGPSGL